MHPFVQMKVMSGIDRETCTRGVVAHGFHALPDIAAPGADPERLVPASHHLEIIGGQPRVEFAQVRWAGPAGPCATAPARQVSAPWIPKPTTKASPNRARFADGLESPRLTFSPKLMMGWQENGSPDQVSSFSNSFSATPSRTWRTTERTLSEVRMEANSNWAI